MTIKFSDLDPITTQIADADIFAVTDLSEGVSKGITFGSLKDAIIDANTFSDNVIDIVSALNNYDSGDGTNDLTVSTANNAVYLAGQTASYYLDYTNFTNTPTDLSDFDNTQGFLKVSGNEVVYQTKSDGDIISTRTIDTDDIIEGPTNLYFTDGRVETFFDNNFAEYFTQFTTTFDEGNATDSLTDTPATFINTSGSGQQITSNTVTITDETRYANYAVGQRLRVYGGTTRFTENIIPSTEVAFTVNSPAFPLGSQHTFNYKIAQFDYTTGEIAPVSNVTRSISIDVPAIPVNSILEAFNDTYFINVAFSNIEANQGVLLYRNFPDVDGATYKLIAVLGPKDLDGGSYIDYYSYDWNPWSDREPDGSFSSIVHFPLNPPIAGRRGWEDAIITSVTQTQSGLNIGLSKTFFVNNDAACFLSHNDTETIQLAIDSNAAIGRKTVTLNAKQYVSSQLEVPDNFGIQGTSSITGVVKLPWSGSPSEPHLLKVKTTQNARNISIVGVDFDGNAKHQLLWLDTTNVQTNYSINLGLSPQNCLLDKVRIERPIAGGLFAPEFTNLRVTNCEFRNNGVTDRYIYSPMIAYNGENLTVTSNTFENFTDFADFSITNKGVITNNIVSNCGSGILIYGSKFMISSPNVLVGPAGEFIPTPDTLNSEYDSVNIRLDNIYLASAQYNSIRFKYQENGFDFDLTANTEAQTGGSDGPLANIFYTLFAIQKDPNGIESLYDTDINDNIALNPQSGFVASQGEFGFSISADDVAALTTGVYSFNAMKNDANNANYNSEHVGIGWSASFEHEVEAGDIGLTAVNNDDTYQVEVNNVKYLSVDSIVRLRGHLASNVPDQNGTIIAITDTGPTTAVVTIEYPGATITQAGVDGTINIIDRFVMAKGRIIS